MTSHYFLVKIETKNGDKCITDLYYKSSFYALFQQYISLRESCYDCKFTGADRVSDITIGNFHEIDDYVEGINRFEGVSKVIINSGRGEWLWKKCEHKVFSKAIDIAELMKDGICFGKGTIRPNNRDEFVADYNKLEFDVFCSKYANRKRYLKQDIYYSLPDVIRKQVKKVLR